MNINSVTYSLDRAADQNVKLDRSNDLESEKKRLFKAAKDMESLFLYQILKAMRSAIPKNEDEDGFGMGGGMGKDIYTQMFDQELAAKMAGIGDRSIAATIYRSMEKTLIGRLGAENGDEKANNTIIPQRNYIDVKQEDIQTTRPLGPASSVNENKEDSTGYDRLIEKTAKKYNLNPELIKSVVMTESAGDPEAVSPAGAKGLMQLTDSTAAEMGVGNVFDPAQNIEGGTKYLKQMVDRFGDLDKALAAYNAGPSRVEKYDGIPPYPETQNYVKNVIDTAGSKQIFYE